MILSSTGDFKFMKNITESTIEKLNRIVKTGHMPLRGMTPYYMASDLANTFEHGVFGLSDLQLIVNDFNEDDRYVFGAFYLNEEGKFTAQNRMLDFIKATGLRVRFSDFDKPVLKNQYKVALYFSTSFNPERKSFELLRREDKNHWTGKLTNGENIQTFERAPERIGTDYELFNVFDIKNPYAEM